MNLKLQFNPSTALKAIIENVLGKEVKTLDELPALPKWDESGSNPSSGGWLDVFSSHVYAWTNDPMRLQYAEDDVVYTRELYNYFGQPAGNDVDSILACSVGVTYWRGFQIDRQRAIEVMASAQKVVDQANCNVNAPVQVRNYLWEVCDEFEKLALPDTSKESLQGILKPEWEESNPILFKRVEEVVTARRAIKEIDLCKKVLQAGRLHANYKVIGTKSNRMSGGSESYVSKGGSVNPQGIKKGSAIRSIFPLKAEGEMLSGGDFSGHEVAIAEARFHDENLREFLLSGKKFHGLFGSVMYQMPYEDVVATSEINGNEPNGFYSRAKTGVFAWFYGAHYAKLADSLWLEEEEVEERIKELEIRFPGIAKARQEIYDQFAALRQPGGLGTKVEWHEPAEYVESFLGFRRYFKLEFRVIKTLFTLAQDPPDSLLKAGEDIKVKRRDRIQTASGAVASALYAAAFNIQAQVMRAAANHHIQSPGGETTKVLQARLWGLQPSGVNAWVIMLMNIHDELMAAHKPELAETIKALVEEVVESYRDVIPLIDMEWKTNLKNWSEK